MIHIGRVTSLVFLLATLLTSSFAHAVDIQFPEEELARESVYPVFDNPTAVKRRNVVLENRVEFGLYGGWSLNDALADPMTGGLMIAYNFTEIHAFQLQGGVFSTSKSQYVSGIEEKLPASGGDLKYIPQPKYLVMGNYQITPFYGKLSITKQTVMNLSLFATAGLGTIAIGDSSYMAFSLGIGQKLYFTDRIGLRADLKMLIHQAPNTLSTVHVGPDPVPNSYYTNHTVNNGMLTVAAIYIL